MSNNQGQNVWEYLETQEGQLKPGFQILDSDIADFSIVSNSAGGVVAKDYSKQLQMILEGLTAAEMDLVRAEVDSSETTGLALEQRILDIDYPVVMVQVEDHLGLRRRLSAAQKPIGQNPSDKGGNGNKRIRMHIRSSGVSSGQLLNGIIPIGGEFRLGTSVSATDVISQIHTLTKQEIQDALDEWFRDGRDAFFARHKVHSAFKYKIAVGDVEFDAKAIVVGALRKSRPQLGDFKTAIFNGNAQTIAQPLRRLGFDVLDMEIDEIELEDDRHQRELLNRGLVGPVERHQLIKSRRGQGIFRDNVESREPKCRITGVSNPRYLRASHIKPWRKSSDIEKIDGDNGLMLAPHVDFLFDRGLISFENDGTLIVSAQIDDGALESWGIPSVVNVGMFSPEQAVYLKFHRENELKC
jgi:hypothetical protein